MLTKRPQIILLILIAIGLIFTSCRASKDVELQIDSLPVDAEIKNDILVGPSALNDPDRFVWGANVIKGKDGKYHMVYNTFECGDSLPRFTDGWVLHSKIAYAISDFPDRDFKFQKIVLQGRAIDGDSTAWDSQMVTNPHIKEFNGLYYLYYVGSTDPGIQPSNSSGAQLNKRNRVQQLQKIGVIEFSSFQDLMLGNFIRPDKPILAPRTRVKKDNVIYPSPKGTIPKPDNLIVNNPSVVYRHSDNKYLLYFKGNIYDPHWRGVHSVAISDSPKGPFKPTDDFVFDIKLENGKLASAEDPFVWYHNKTNLFYAIIKDFSGKITESNPGLAILKSKDGIRWIKPNNPLFMNKVIHLENGQMVKVNRLERPFLLIDEEGNPLVFFGACSIVDINPRKDGVSFNIHIPVLTNLK